MVKKNVYCIPVWGTSGNYYHFTLGCLFPLIYYDIVTNHKHKYVIKINIGKMSTILDFIFPGRITLDYIPSNMVEVGDKQNYFDTFISLKKNCGKNDILLDPYDIFGAATMVYIIPDFDKEELIRLERLYVEYYSTPAKKRPKQKKDWTRYKKLYITDKYLKFINTRHAILGFFNSLNAHSSYHTPPVILIEREFNGLSSLENLTVMNVKSTNQRRIIYNHDKLRKRLEDDFGNNFRNVVLEKLSFYEQYLLFRNARVIIGQHGAGLVNIVYSQDINATLIEISSDWNNGHFSFENISHTCNINYISIPQNGMTKREWYKMNDISYTDIDESVFGYKAGNRIEQSLANIKKITDNFKVKLNTLSIEVFIKNSGSVSISSVMKAVHRSFLELKNR